MENCSEIKYSDEGGQQEDDNESGSDSNEGLEQEETTVIWNSSENDLKNEDVMENDIEVTFQNQVLQNRTTKACLNPTASEIVMHDHNFMRKYKSTKLVGKGDQNSSRTKRSQQQQQPGLCLNMPPLVPSQNNPIPNVILTTMDGKPFQLAPGSQILRFIRSTETSLSKPMIESEPEVIESSDQSMGYQIISVSSNTTMKTVNSNPSIQNVVHQNQNSLPISILSSNSVSASSSNENSGIYVINNPNAQMEATEATVLMPENAFEIQFPKNKTDICKSNISQTQPISFVPSPSNSLMTIVKSQGSNDQVQQRFMYLAGLCRVCLVRKDHVVTIFMDVNIGPNGIIENSRGPHAASRYNIISALKTLLDVDVYYGDGLPENICVDCLDNLMSFSVFRKRISIGQSKLNEIIAQVQGTPNITLINDMGEKDIRKTDVFRHCDSIIRANEMIKSSSFAHCAIRNLPDRVLDKIFAAMSLMVGFKSGKLKELEMYAIQEPYITAWFCYTCNLTIHGSHEVYAQHYVEVHEINDAEDVLFPCDICGSAFNLTDCTGMSQNYAEHWLQHFFFHECNMCFKKMPSIKGMWVHKRSAHSTTDKIYQCHICEKAFSKKAHLDAHKKTHLDPEDRKQHLNWCKICGKGLTSSLAAHISSVHSEERPWKCEICNKGFKRKEILNGHRSTVHYNLKKYQCELCGVYLKSHSSKAQHLLRHKGEKLHCCSVCDKRFYSSHALRSHMIRHKESGENQCTICSKIFKRKIYLTEHMRLHTGEKPHECHICGKQIRMKSNYYKHMKIHSRRSFENKETVTLEVDLT